MDVHPPSPEPSAAGPADDSATVTGTDVAPGAGTRGGALWRGRWIVLAAAVMLGVAGLAVWPVPAMWQHATVTDSRLLLRSASLITSPGEPTALGIPADQAVAATAFLGWDEPVRLADSCLTRASIALPAGWVDQAVFMIPGQIVVAQGDPSRVVVEQPADVERFLRPTFVRASRDVAEPGDVRATARIERVCDGVSSKAVDLVLEVDVAQLTQSGQDPAVSG